MAYVFAAMEFDWDDIKSQACLKDRSFDFMHARWLRQRLGLTQQELSQRIGWSLDTLRN